MRWKTVVLSLAFVASVVPIANAQPQGTQEDQPRLEIVPRRIRVGGNVMTTQILKKVEPVYPPEAAAAHVSGTVVLHAVIARDGSVQQLDVVSGPPMLLQPAMDAVHQWRYKPMLLNGQPIEVDTTISVVFSLGGGAEQNSQEQQGDSQASRQPADDGSTNAAPQIDPQFRADILHLFDVMHLQDNATNLGQTLFQSLAPILRATLPPTPNREQVMTAYVGRLAALFQSQEFVDRSVEMYAKYFSDDDVKALAEFYQTPAGQHYNAASAQLASDGVRIGQEIARKKMPEILQSLCKEFPELQGTANFCPSDKLEKKGLLTQPKPGPAAIQPDEGATQ